MSKLKIAVLVSGGGTNLQAIIDKIASGEITNTEIALVFSNNRKAYGLERAKMAGIPAKALSPKQFENREAFNDAVLEVIEESKADLIVLAGCLMYIPPKLIEKYHNRIINIHPALLPSFRGLHAQRQAIEAGVKVAGCTVHFVGTGLDDGPIITQTAVPVYDNDTEETLSARILTREHPTYVCAVAAFCADKLTISGNHVSGMHSEEE